MVDAKLLIFFRWSTMVLQRRTNPANRRGGSGCVERGLAKGTGVFLPWVMAHFLVKDTEMVTMMEIVPPCIVLVDCGVNFTLGTTRTAIPASQ
jgi:hypothetical protein